MVYLHWTDLISRDESTWLFNLFGQDYRESKVMEDEQTLFENEVKAVRQLFQNKYIDPKLVFDKALISWQRGEAEAEDIERAQRAFAHFEQNPDITFADDSTPLTREGNIDTLPD